MKRFINFLRSRFPLAALHLDPVVIKHKGINAGQSKRNERRQK